MKIRFSKCLFVILLLFLITGCNKKKYQIISYEYKDNYYIDTYEVKIKEILLNNFSDFQKFKKKYNIEEQIEEDEFKQNSFIVVFDNNACDSEQEISQIKLYDNILEILYSYHNVCGLCAPHTDIYLYKIAKVDDNVNIKTKTKKIKDEECDPNVTYKPILYIYPRENMYVNIKLENDNDIITSYPKYDNGWNVFVNKDGKIFYNNREFYGLYWDEYSQNNVDFNEGFYVDGKNAISFLENKLDLIGLNNRESNEFIMYWLPILEKNEKSLVYFELTNERESNNKLLINPKPDSLLRINMHVKKINKKINIKEQKLEPFNRIGYTIVEWGGTVYKED